MARAKSFIKLSGSLGETTFKKVGKKNYAIEKVSISDGRMKSNSSFKSLRKNGRQMGNASKTSKAIRFALNSFVHHCKDSKMVGRLNAEVMKVLKRDTAPGPGAYVHGKIARAENMELLLGFDFNDKVRLRATFNVPFTIEVNRETGEVKIHIASFIPDSAIKSPRLATQFAIMAQVAGIDFDPAVDFKSKYKSVDMKSSAVIALDNTPTAPVSITFKIKTGHVNTIFVALGVDFHDFENPLYDTIDLSRRVSSGCIVGVDEGVTVPFVGPVPYEIVEEGSAEE